MPKEAFYISASFKVKIPTEVIKELQSMIASEADVVLEESGIISGHPIVLADPDTEIEMLIDFNRVEERDYTSAILVIQRLLKKIPGLKDVKVIL